MQFDQDIDHLTKSGQDFSAKVQMIHGSALPKVWLKVLLKALVKVLVKVLVKALVKQMWIPQVIVYINMRNLLTLPANFT